jgi:TPP-dependent pyruvate/acetoin dehydrogenase alpha subunit
VNIASTIKKPYLIECKTFRMRGHEEAVVLSMYRHFISKNGKKKILFQL